MKISSFFFMEFRNIENTKSCRRLHELLVRSSDQTLTGEPWFRFVAGSLYFSSRTESAMVANLMMSRRDVDGKISFNAFLNESDFAPLKKLIGEHGTHEARRDLSHKQRDFLLCQDLASFFRINYREFK